MTQGFGIAGRATEGTPSIFTSASAGRRWDIRPRRELGAHRWRLSGGSRAFGPNGIRVGGGVGYWSEWRSGSGSDGTSSSSSRRGKLGSWRSQGTKGEHGSSLRNERRSGALLMMTRSVVIWEQAAEERRVGLVLDLSGTDAASGQPASAAMPSRGSED
ncbi:hypothetical protein DENSPDRAFT_853349 [Dentipellis sp. KUC8613]|nr:hypothetical protein DENSPDRAFT_853349 [Dentipellis sp. KUC8613]